MRVLTGLVLPLVLGLTLAAPAAAKPPLRDVAKIDDHLMAVAIADEIRKSCEDISPRMIKAYSVLRSLKSDARALGYSDEEIEDYVTSKAEKARMRAKADAWLKARGVDPKDRAALCAFGKTEIARGSRIGELLY
ncbi:DUF5333 domain-containing protein [Thalassococcus sp. CAU 1522]|uniref:DUF5333 domain-containing protein n=1 Tax=Thalassococcus arenae TaxID=2851652 RepID=A0ABS6N9U6_9RHOB|nr:DUF5333 domain-containing protein [Thalassococcus arenae]MBV2360568.1 DUF5333 domain-containing protein [Thalassococcus arenae]